MTIEPSGSITLIDVDLIKPSPYQHRRTFTQSKLSELASSIKRDGLIEPIVIRSLNGAGGYELIAGERRLRACKLVGIPSILSRVVDVSDLQARRMCAAENLQRENLSPVEEVAAIVEMVDAEMIEDEEYRGFGENPKARVNFLLTKLDSDRRMGVDYYSNKFVGKIESIFSNLPKPTSWQSFYIHDFRPLAINLDSDVAQVAAENKLNKSQTKALNEVKEKNPELFDDLKAKAGEDGQVTLRLLNENFQMEEVPLAEASAREIAQVALRGTTKVSSVFSNDRLIIRDPEAFNVIYADPPWAYDNAIKSWGPARLHYEDMALEDICLFPEKQLKLKVADNAVLFLWATNPFLQDAFKVIEAWGFEYKTNIVWVKTKLVKPGSGFYVRGRHELLMICTRGSFLPLDHHLSPPIGSVLEAPLDQHSKKPIKAYEIIERLYPGCKYIELFSRNERKGWTSRGREVINEPSAA